MINLTYAFQVDYNKNKHFKNTFVEEKVRSQFRVQKLRAKWNEKIWKIRNTIKLFSSWMCVFVFGLILILLWFSFLFPFRFFLALKWHLINYSFHFTSICRFRNSKVRLLETTTKAAKLKCFKNPEIISKQHVVLNEPRDSLQKGFCLADLKEN